QTIADRVTRLSAQTITGKPHCEGRPGAAAKSDLRKCAQILRHSRDAERLVPALPHTRIHVGVHVPIYPGSEVVEEPWIDNVVMVGTPSLTGDGLELKALQHVGLVGESGYLVRESAVAGAVD